MEEREIFNETEYIEGFNLGYKMADISPEISEIISKAKTDDEKFIGIKDGISQYVLEMQEIKDKEQDKSISTNSSPSWLRDDRIESIDKETDLNKKMDKNKGKDLEPGI